MESLTDVVIHAKYRIGRSLGEGGMGAVYLAEHIGIGRRVAVKVVRPELLTDATAAERFTREARAAGGLQHRHVVNVTDFGVDTIDGHDIAYLVMEALQGETLEEVLEARGPLRLPQVVDIVTQVVSALSAAHARGVVHRDLKPANIFLTPDARGGFHVTLLDFGIAKLRDDTFSKSGSSSRNVGERTNSLIDNPMATQAGESIGTPAYMSPEQCVGDEVDARSDLYSLGVVVYQMLSGTLPFRGDTLALLRQHFVAEVPALPATANVPAAVEAVLRRALSKDPDARFQSAVSFGAALRAHSMGFGDSMRRALAIFAERMPELSALGLCFALPAVGAALVGLSLVWLPFPFNAMPWMFLLSLALLMSTPLAMASIATVFGDIRERPFHDVTWRDVARRVSGSTKSGFPLYLAWLKTAAGNYLRASRKAGGGGIKVMLHFVDQYRHQGTQSSPERLAQMAAVMPGSAFATMVVAQFAAILLLPVLAVFAALGVADIAGLAGSARIALVALAGGAAFTAALFLQVFIALVDVMLYDLTHDMTGA
ncbi:MAG: serine/threonine protein kinase [Gemmatimonadaceae bacterium]|nr:serine/threonine protein kinase [Gemmatimonadaceae bacterium]